MLADTPVVVAIYHTVNDTMRLHEEVDVLSRVNVPQEVLVDSDEQLNVSVVVDRGPNLAQLVIDVCQITLVLQELLDQKHRERLRLLHVHVRG